MQQQAIGQGFRCEELATGAHCLLANPPAGAEPTPPQTASLTPPHIQTLVYNTRPRRLNGPSGLGLGLGCGWGN